jgi:hypothetical protein
MFHIFKKVIFLLDVVFKRTGELVKKGRTGILNQVMWWILKDVSEELTTSIIKGEISSEMSANHHQTTRHIPGETYLNSRRLK